MRNLTGTSPLDDKAYPVQPQFAEVFRLCTLTGTTVAAGRLFAALNYKFNYSLYGLLLP
jgi:hypothetical protein